MIEKALGICLGSSTIKIAEAIKENNRLYLGKSFIRNHESNPAKALKDLLEIFQIDKYDYICATGRKFKDLVNFTSITEPEATEYALKYTYFQNTYFDALASLGSENFIVYNLSKNNIINVETGNKCASGTGEFFLQQVRRMNLSIDEASKLSENSPIHKVSGRCSVFCKSDCTHALNIGIPIGEVCAGLSFMIANKALDLLEKTGNNSVLVVGGVVNNNTVLKFLREKIDNLTIAENYDTFEAVGAAFYALENRTVFKKQNIFRQNISSFNFLKPIKHGNNLVSFKQMEFGTAKHNEECILGLDVGSTTTKAVVIRTSDESILASVYLRTDGDPIKASKNCYRSLLNDLKVPIKLIGLGITGSGRQIAGLYAMTDGIINEIIAHATSAVFFDSEVDTIYEIGGQDAKYTYLTNGVPSDYAMNEACSAGTGSFLEESAKESLGINYFDIEQIALKSEKPPNFNDQCSAFISSDIKNASQEGINKEDIIAGLVFSICMNYDNRVKGSRPSGKKIFMQGGVCYNKAVPLAMACLIDKEIIVPPEPGLMGAFGVALEINKRIKLGLMKKKEFQLESLIKRSVNYSGDFICKGTSENCDRKCNIKIINIENKNIPFGGACNKYYNIIHNNKFDSNANNLVSLRQEIIFNKYLMAPSTNENLPIIGISRAFLTNLLYPMYYNFFTKLGFKVILSDNVDSDGIKRQGSSFCFPGEIAHGEFANLIKKNPDFIFLPHIVELFVENSFINKKEHQCTCFLLQSEPYYIKTAFKDLLTKNNIKLLSPVLDFSKGWDTQKEAFIKIAHLLNVNQCEAIQAYDFAITSQKEAFQELKLIGKNFIENLKQHPDNIAIVLFGRPYNAFANEANLGIPNKFASRGVKIIPYDMLPFEEYDLSDDITWAIGQNIMKAAKFIKQNPQLFGTFISNFSCGPDSFIISYFRQEMGNKPSLTLELDNHTADAGINTRVEAYLDIIDRYKKIKPPDNINNFNPSKLEYHNKTVYFVNSKGEKYNIKDKNVTLLFPSMNVLSSEAVSATFNGMGFNAKAVKGNDFSTLILGRKNASCKECLPLILVVGSLLDYMKNNASSSENIVYFLPTASGNCRFSQYNIFLNKLIKNKQLSNVALLTLTSENSYAGIGTQNSLKILKAFIIADIMDNIRKALIVLAVNKEESSIIFSDQWSKIIHCLKSDDYNNLYTVIEDVAYTLKKIPLKYPLNEAKIVSILGEIFVRKNEFSCQNLVELLAKKDIIAQTATTTEWLNYVDYLVNENILESEFGIIDKLKFKIKVNLQARFEHKIIQILSKSGLCHCEPTNINKLIEYGKNFVNINLTGEPILVIGSFFKEIIESVHGVISIGPFACLPTRVTEAILSKESTLANKILIDGKQDKYHDYKSIDKLPFLSIESDGNPFPAIIESRIEAFCLQVDRIHKISAKRKECENIESTLVIT
ncbi:MAG: acyl-CoA dehydratase activase [Cyanobacteriota bacterium]